MQTEPWTTRAVELVLLWMDIYAKPKDMPFGAFEVCSKTNAAKICEACRVTAPQSEEQPSKNERAIDTMKYWKELSAIFVALAVSVSSSGCTPSGSESAESSGNIAEALDGGKALRGTWMCTGRNREMFIFGSGDITRMEFAPSGATYNGLKAQSMIVTFMGKWTIDKRDLSFSFDQSRMSFANDEEKRDWAQFMMNKGKVSEASALMTKGAIQNPISVREQYRVVSFNKPNMGLTVLEKRSAEEAGPVLSCALQK